MVASPRGKQGPLQKLADGCGTSTPTAGSNPAGQ